jgi:hypothetical protein
MRNPLCRAFRALENFNFRLWTAGGLVSNIGTWMQRVAQDWIVLTQLILLCYKVDTWLLENKAPA